MSTLRGGAGAIAWGAVLAAAGMPAALLGLRVARRIREREAALRAENVRLRHLALTDVLTGLDNRRAFRHRLGEAVAFARRQSLPVAVILLDLDHFKAINDRHGHATGDRVLWAVARALTTDARAEDVVARWGGEEFALVLPGTDLAGALARAERLRARIGELSLLEVDGDAPHRVSASFGVASAPECGTPRADRLVSAADRALYAAKRAGRNRCAVAPLDEAPAPPEDLRRPGHGPGAVRRRTPGHLGPAPRGSPFRSV